MKRHTLWIVLSVVIALGVVYFAFDPTSSHLFPRCPFLTLTGLRCPGCGSQRALHSLLHGEIVRAAHYNLLLTLSLPFVATTLVAETNRERWPRLYRRINSQAAIYATLAVTCLWWVARNALQL